MKTVQLNNGFVALVDDVDFERVSDIKWCAMKNNNVVYAKSSDHNHQYSMHRLILNAPRSIRVDHIDRDGLNNQRGNLRLCTATQNAQNQTLKKSNTSGFKGVNWEERDQAWRARIVVGGKRISLGSFKSAAVAALAYDLAAVNYFGDFARLNFSKQSTAR